jgi:predicted metal-dependent phosphotriesterase family hydrolase
LTFARTVLGDMDVTKLGATNAHEHVMIRGGLILLREPDFRLDDPSKAIEELSEYRAFGGGTVVDTAPIGIGRDPDALVRIARESKVNIIAATGFHKTAYYLDTHWRFHYSADDIAKLFIDEIEIGMEQNSYIGPLIRRSQARAGVIKIASDYQLINSATRVGAQAAAAAHAKTGAPVLTHTEMGTMAMAQLELLNSHGVKPEHIVLSHMDRNPDLGLHKEAAQSGAFLEYDGAGRVKYFPESTLLELMRNMFDAGLGSHLLLGGDTARRSYWKAYGGGPGIAYIMEHFCGRMRRDGFTQLEIDEVLIHNPARAFVFASVSG